MENKIYLKQNTDGFLSCDIGLSVEDWIAILQNGDITTSNYQYALLCFYKEPGHSSTCKALGEKIYGSQKDAQKFNSWIMHYGQNIVNNLDRFHIYDFKDKERFWPVTMLGKDINDGLFEWTLRPEIVQAIEKLGWNKRIPIVNEKIPATFASKVLQELSKFDELENLKPYIVKRERTGWQVENVYELIDNSSGHFLNSLLYIPSNGEAPGESQGWNKHTIIYCGHHIYYTASDWYNPNLVNDQRKHRHNVLELIYFVNKAYNGIFQLEYKNGNHIMYALNSLSQQNTKQEIKIGMVDQKVKDIEAVLRNSGQVILQGAPGCGKTYITTELAVYLCDGNVPEGTSAQKKRYKELQDEGRIGFTTFHQSLDYEEFVEGLKPETDDKTGEMHFEVKPGIFRRMCSNALAVNETNFDEAYSKFIADIYEKDEITILSTVNGNQFGVTANSNNNLSLYTGSELNKNGVLTKERLRDTANGVYSDFYSSYFRGVINHLSEKYGYTESVSTERKNYVLIIDEINRANISKVLGELITLLEKSKRLGNDDEFTVTLPYSGDTFGVPDNLYIIGTMNTADRSLGCIDYAIRRRFAFMTLEADPFIIKERYNFRGNLMEKEIKLFNDIKTIIKRHISDDFDIKDIMVGHSYFLSKDDEDFRINLDYKIRPLLEEYLRDGILVENGTVKDAIEKLGKENVQ